MAKAKRYLIIKSYQIPNVLIQVFSGVSAAVISLEGRKIKRQGRGSSAEFSKITKNRNRKLSKTYKIVINGNKLGGVELLFGQENAIVGIVGEFPIF
ncbi:MAG: hypothetical protein NC094_12970 [Bacteroidales bacterium]|nr:hypothetical protein [Bacteroidales bacterium]